MVSLRLRDILDWLGRLNTVLAIWSLAAAAVLAAATGIIGWLHDASFATLALLLIVSFIAPMVGLACIFLTAALFQRRSAPAVAPPHGTFVVASSSGAPESSAKLVGSSITPSEASPPIFAPLDVFYTHDTAPGRGYPHKLWIVLRNESDSSLFLHPATWNSRDADFAIRPLDRHPWTPEGRDGWQSGSWNWATIERQYDPLSVPPGRVVRTWVGLPGPVTDAELRRRLVSKRLGTLVVPFTIAGREQTQTISL